MPKSQAAAEFAEVADFFFHKPDWPAAKHERGGTCSILYLLRRELIDTLGYDPDADSEEAVGQGGPRHRLFASLILMFTTIDLLAKFKLGDKGKVGERFIDFLKDPDGGALDEWEAGILYAVRNSMAHAFGLPDAGSLTKLSLSNIAIAQYAPPGCGGPVAGLADRPTVYVDRVYEVVVALIARYRESLYGSAPDSSRELFLAAFEKYGSIGIALG